MSCRVGATSNWPPRLRRVLLGGGVVPVGFSSNFNQPNGPIDPSQWMVIPTFTVPQVFGQLVRPFNNTSRSGAFYIADPAMTQNQYSQVTALVATDGNCIVGAATRCRSLAATFYFAALSRLGATATLRLARVDSGVATIYNTVPLSAPIGSTVLLLSQQVSGGALISAYVNNIIRATHLDPAPILGGFPGAVLSVPASDTVNDALLGAWRGGDL